MPIVQDVGTLGFSLQCINRHHNTMVAVAEATALPIVVSTPYGPVLGSAVKIRCYYCRVCHYTEFYMDQPMDDVPPEKQDADPSTESSPSQQ